MSDIELILILGFYYIAHEKNLDKFTAIFNAYFGKDVSSQMILHEISRFRNVDPANNINVPLSSSRYQMIWNNYITDEKLPELKELYKSFNSQKFIELSGKQEVEKIEKLSINYIVKDEPKKYESPIEHKTQTYIRNQSVVEHALSAAGYTCEGDCNCALFLRKDRNNYYTEGHHLIPLCFQPLFDYSLDVEANVVSLCPRCHRLLHYGLDKENLLWLLYQKRIKRLKKCGISISFEKLLLFYSGNCLN